MIDRARVAVLASAVLVGAAAVAATAHGGYEVAVACQVPPGIAWLYPPITDGLALVAYAATRRLHGPGLAYAWAVVVVAAGLSGLAQAVYLASGPALDTSPTLRFGVGAWPAVAGAVAAHLVYLLAHPARPGETGAAPAGAVVAAGAETATVAPGPAGVADSVPTEIETGVGEWVGEAGDQRETQAGGVVEHPRESGRATLAIVPPTAGDPVAALIAGGAGRRKVAEKLGITEHAARQLLEAHHAQERA